MTMVTHRLLLAIALPLGLTSAFEPTPACPNPVTVEHGIGCLCTEGSCGTYPDSTSPPADDEALVVTTSTTGGFLVHSKAPVTPISPSSAMMGISVNPSVEIQEILGFGTSITDASAFVLDGLSPTLKAEAIEQAYGHAGFSMSRVPMNSADFSRMNYVMAYERDLSDFCLRDDRTPDGENVTCGEDYKLDVLEAIAKVQPDHKLTVSAWSAPPTFKYQNFSCSMVNFAAECVPDLTAAAQNNCTRTVADPNTCIGQPLGVPCNTTPPHDYEPGYPVFPGQPGYDETAPIQNANGNCYNTGFISENAFQSWANMYVKFIEAYEARNVSVWALTSQNEPYQQNGLWGGDFFTVDTMNTFVKDYLSPTIKSAKPSIKLMLYDDQYINLTDAALEMAEATLDVADGIAYHWYTSLESGFENSTAAPPIPLPGIPAVGGQLGVKTLYDKFGKDKFLMM